MYSDFRILNDASMAVSGHFAFVSLLFTFLTILEARERTNLGTDSGTGPISVNRDRSRSSDSTDTDLALIHHSAHRLFDLTPPQ